MWLVLMATLPLHAQKGRTPASGSPQVDLAEAELQTDVVRPSWRTKLESKGVTIHIEAAAYYLRTSSMMN